MVQWLTVSLAMQGSKLRKLKLLQPRHLKPKLNKSSHHKEKPEHHNEKQPPLSESRQTLHTAA